MLTLPALYKSPSGAPTAFYAVVSVAVIGLYLAFLIPIALRLRMGDRFVPGPWTLGRKYKVLGWIAVIEIAVISVYFILPIVPAGVPGQRGLHLDRGQLRADRRRRPAAAGRRSGGCVSAKNWFTGPLPHGRRAGVAEADVPRLE